MMIFLRFFSFKISQLLEMCGLHIAVGKLRLIASVYVQLVFFLKNNSCILFFSILIREKNICLKNRKEKNNFYTTGASSKSFGFLRK